MTPVERSNTMQSDQPRRDEPLTSCVDTSTPPIVETPARTGVDAGDEAIRTIDEMSRRIEVLARQLNVLGHFDDSPDRPRAA